MIVLNGKKYYNEKEVMNFVSKKMKDYYYSYVEGIERDHDQLLDKVTELESILNSVGRNEDIERYREMVRKANQERDKAKHDLADILKDISEGKLRRWNV